MKGKSGAVLLCCWDRLVRLIEAEPTSLENKLVLSLETRHGRVHGPPVRLLSANWVVCAA